jgi:hypothetical protein
VAHRGARGRQGNAAGERRGGKGGHAGSSAAPAELQDDGADVGQLDVAAYEPNDAGLLETPG